jgi:sulfotransferase
MDKTFFFMAGLPRSGSTLLSAILNQNPDIYVSSSSDTPSLMLSLYSASQISECYHAGFEPLGYRNIMSKLPQVFYSHIDKPYIIDKNRTWGVPDHLELASMITDNIKIIAPVRPILEILASFINLAERNPNNFIDRFVPEYPVSDYRSRNDARCDALMAANKHIEMQTLSIASSLIPQHKDKFHFVAYADLISKPKKVIDAIYDFLDIPKFEHHYENLKWNILPNEFQVFGIPNLHKVRSKIDPSKTNTSVLSNYVKQKYGHHLDFIFPNGIKDFV